MLIRLPGGIQTHFQRPANCTISTVKNTVEDLYGIPRELQIVSWKEKNAEDSDIVEVEDDGKVGEICVAVQEDWREMVSLCLEADRKSLPQIISIITNNKNDLKFVFVSLFLCARLGLPSFVSSILSVHNDFDLSLTTNVTGRTILHAAVKSGSLKCVEEIKKIAGMKFEQLLQIKNNFGSTPLDCLHRDHLRMINYINKFVSKPISLSDLDDKDKSHESDDNIKDLPNNADTDSRQKRNIKTEKFEQYSTDTEHARPPDQSSIENKSHVKLTRSKNEKNDEGLVSQTISKNSDTYTSMSISPIISESTKTLKIGDSVQNQSNTTSTLPVIASGIGANKSPKTRRKGSLVPFNNTLPAVTPSTVTPPVVSPHPPLLEKKKKPVAGVLKESSARKYSVARNTQQKNGNKLQSQMAPMRRPLVNQKVLNVPATCVDVKTPPSNEKVRRISRIQNPQHTADLESSSTTQQKVIEIEKDRIEKPWNVWIKAVTVDADSDVTVNLVTPSLNNEKDGVSRKISLQVQSDAKSRKKSFDEWVLYKTQLEIAESQKSKDDDKNKEEEESRWKHGKTFEQWKKEKEEYDKHMQEQKENDEKENKPPKQYLKGKTFEQWQHEKAEREKLEIEEKRIKEAKDKEEIETSKNRRRKESSAKYQQWLLDKEMRELEKEMQARQSIANRKISSTKTFTNAGRKRRSMTS